MTTKAVTAGTDFAVGSTLNVNGIPYVVSSIAGNTLTIVPKPGPNPTASTTDTLTGGTKVANGPTFPNVELADGSVLSAAGGGTIPALPLTIANGGTGAATAATLTVFGNNTGSTAAPAFTNAPSVNSVTVNAVAPTVGAGQVAIGATHQTTVGAAGGASSLPATPTGYLIINVAGTAMVIPYYAQA